MEYLLSTFGGKLCCIFASGAGGLANVLTQKKWNLSAIKDIVIAVVVGWICAEFFIPAAMAHFQFGPEAAIALAFIIGYCGIRLLPKIEDALMSRIK
tara:strand:+ start:1167 stop:1457 length:291 start_codon:yes stop_codon:yes gene_type:complete